MHRSIGFAAFLVLLAGAAPVSRAQPPGQAADSIQAQTEIPRLANFASLVTIMNLARGTVRILAVVSPSSADAQAGMDAIASILKDIPSKRLRTYVILARAVDADTELRALAFASRHRDRRIVYLWDPDAAVPAAMTGTAGFPAGSAGNVCLLYDTDATFTTAPPEPVLWMPMAPRGDGPRLDDGSLRDTAATLVRSVERKASAAPATTK